MLRVGTSVMLIVAQVAMVCAAPLAVCTEATGNQCLDFGAASCVCCQPEEDACCHEHEGACSHEHQGGLPCEDDVTLHGNRGRQPCDCDHRPLTDESQVARRAIWDLEMFLCLDVAAADRFDARGGGASAVWSALVTPNGSHSDLLDLKTVCLRC